MSMPRKNLIVGAAIVIFIVGVVAAGRYAALAPRTNANPHVEQQPITPAAQPHVLGSMTAMPTPAKGKVDSVDVMVERLRTRLEREPNDVDGWVLLGRSYHHLERWDDAKAAFAKARALGYQGDTGVGAEAAASENAAVQGAGSGDAVFNDIGRVGSARAEDAPAAVTDEAKP